MKRRFKPTEYS